MTANTEKTSVTNTQELYCIKFDSVPQDKLSEGAAIRKKIEACSQTLGINYPSTLLTPINSSHPVLISYDRFKSKDELKEQIALERSSPEFKGVIHEAQTQLSAHEFRRGVYINDRGHFSSASNFYLVIAIFSDASGDNPLLQKCRQIWGRFAEENIEQGVIQIVDALTPTFNSPPGILWTIGFATSEDLDAGRRIIEEDNDLVQPEHVKINEYEYYK